MKIIKFFFYILILVLVTVGGYFYYQKQIAEDMVSVPVQQVQDHETQSKIHPNEAPKPYHDTILINQGKILFHHGVPTEPLLNILSHEGIQARTPEGILEETQAKWLGKVGDSRHHIPNIQPVPPSPEELEQYRQVGMAEKLMPTQKYYTYGIILGTVTSFMADALNHLIELWEKEGVRFEKLIFLTGERPLYREYVAYDRVPKEILNPGEAQPTLKTEPEAARFLADRMALRFPPGFPQGDNLIILDAKASPGQIRASTQDTVRAFLNLHMMPGTYLAASQQPFAGRQALVLEKEFAKAGFKGEVIATPAIPEMPKSFYLDSLARWIYELVKE